MKKSIRKVICLALMTIMVTSMIVPAMAVSGITPSGHEYQYPVTRTDTSGRTEVAITSAAPAYVTAYVKNKVYNELNNMWIYPDAKNEGYISVSATAGTIKNLDGYLFDGILYETTGDCWVAGTQVAVGIYAEYVGE